MEERTQTTALVVVNSQLPAVAVPGTDLVETRVSSKERRVKANKTAILEAMKKAGIKTATVEYTGQGDSGDGMDVSVEGGFQLVIDTGVTILVENSRWNEVERRWETDAVLKETSLGDALEKMAEDLIELHHSGYEDGDGGGGSITFDADAESLSYEYYNYYTEKDSHSVDV